MTLNDQIYNQFRLMLYNRFAYPIEQIQPEIRFQIELAVDSLEMFEIMAEIEKTFNITINQDDIDNFIFQPQDIIHIAEIKCLTIQDVVNYIEKQLTARDKFDN